MKKSEDIIDSGSLEKELKEPEIVKITDKKDVKGVVYIGPTIPDVVVKNTVFNNGVTQNLESYIEKYSYIKALLVPLEEYSKLLAEAQKSGSSIFNLCKKVRKDIANGRL